MLPLNDLPGNALVVAGLRPTRITTNTSTTGFTLDANQAAVHSFINLVVMPGVITDGTYVYQVTESDNSDMSSASNVTAGPESGTVTLTSADSNGYRGTAGATHTSRFPRTRRYVRVNITSTSVGSRGFHSAVFVVSKNRPGETASAP